MHEPFIPHSATHLLDAIDGTILAERTLKRSARSGPRVGDFIHMLDGTLRRFTYHWGDGMQTTYRWRDTGEVGTGSFYLDRSGDVSYSGSLDDAIPLSQIEQTDEQKEGVFWFFHHNESRAHNGVDVKVPCRVFRQK
ncbi:MAG TPA: hypothetical protein VGJ20_20360 [Xanthobacteraceae bacterium]|jgi:hypothetical protein